MHSYHIDAFGGPDNLGMREQAQPEPGPTEIVVRIRARSLNYRDVLILERRYPVPAREGVVPISDGAGEVVAVGPQVSRFAVGDRVAATYFPRWIDGPFAMHVAMEQFGCTRDGLLADFLLADEQALVKVPAHLSFEESATLACAGLTAWSGLTGPRPVVAGETVLTIGSGGVALFAMQFAKLFGARVIAVTSTAEKTSLLQEHGADATVVTGEHEAWDVAVRDLTDGHGVDHVVETGGLKTLPYSLKSCADAGELALAAVLGDGTLAAPALSGATTIRRYYVGSRAAFEKMNTAIARNGLRPVIDSVYPFEQAREAYQHFASRRQSGKVVIGG
jgi:NADPH:quinone reductase-like Zn-dependent oxidoreductase